MEDYKAFSLSEISLHTSKKDCWLIISGKVYDVTKFLEDHPGGEEVLIEASANGDATMAFEVVGHSSTATSMMSSYFIGVVDGSDSGNGAEHSKAVKEEKVEEFVANKTAQQHKKPSSVSMNLFEYLLIPVIVFGVAFAAWYFLNQANS